MNQDWENFGSRLKDEREARALTIGDVARKTRIPTHAIQKLEAGTFSELPADVFVRGFLRSYCRCVGLEPEETVRRYGELTRSEKWRREPPLVRLTEAQREAMAAEAEAEQASSPEPSSSSSSSSSEGAPSPEKKPDNGVMAQALLDAGRGTRRASLTLAVIILVIVATLTLSLLLRRPSHVGDGLSLLPASSETIPS